MSFEKYSGAISKKENIIANKEKESHSISFPNAERALRLFRKKYIDETEKSQILEDVFYEFFVEEMENSQIFESTKLGASFPWTVIKTKELAEKIYASIAINKDKQSIPGQTKTTIAKQEFIFGSFINTTNGNQFTFAEEAMHQAMKVLSSNLESLQEGREISEHEIYTLGSPTNELGSISNEFLNRLKKAPFDALAELYAEFAESKITATVEKDKKNSVLFYGISMGGSFAAATAEKLIQKEEMSQELNLDKPSLQVRMDVPVGLSKSNMRKWQIPIGFAAEGIFQAIAEPAIIKQILGEKKFLDQVKLKLKDKGIKEHMDDEDIKKKKEAISAVINALRQGVEFSQKLKVTKVSGVYDPLTFSFEQYATDKKREMESDQTLGKNLAPRVNENHREFKINMPHTPPFFRDNELERFYRITKTIEQLKNQTK